MKMPNIQYDAATDPASGGGGGNQLPVNPAPTKLPKHGSGDGNSKRENWLRSYATEIALAIIFVLMATIIATLIYRAGIYDNLRDPAYARGVITFLIVLSAIGLGFFLTILTFFGSCDTQAEAEKFRRGREVHAVLVGVMGTVVGFYFGNAEKNTSKLEVTSPQIIATTTGKHLAAHITGGTPPYRYTLTFETANSGVFNPSALNVTNKFSDGWISEDFSNANISNVKLSVTDKNEEHKEVSASTKAQ
jgi:hypothetical protein